MKDEYPQMMAWFERHEKVLRNEKYLRQQISGHVPDSDLPVSHPTFGPFLVHPRELKMAKHPSARGVSLKSLKTDYGAYARVFLPIFFQIDLLTPTCTENVIV